MKAELTLRSIKVGDDIVTWNETLANVSSKLYIDTSNEFKKQIMLIYDEAELPYSSIEVTALNPKVTRIRSVRKGEPIVADYDAQLIFELLEVPLDATEKEIEELINSEINVKVDSAVEKLNNDGTLVGAQSNMITVGTNVSEIAQSSTSMETLSTTTVSVPSTSTSTQSSTAPSTTAKAIPSTTVVPGTTTTKSQKQVKVDTGIFYL